MTTELKMQGLEKLVEILKDANQPVARVGILGNSGRSDGAMSNATIGAQHEFGTSKLPQRSFLRVPIADNMQKAMDDSGAFSEASLKKVISEGSTLGWVKRIAILAEGIVGEAFNSGGFGKWPPSDMLHKKVKMTLVETQQLRNSITSEVS